MMRQVEWARRVQDMLSFFSEVYPANEAVQVMAELVSDSSEQWSLIKIQNIWVELF